MTRRRGPFKTHRSHLKSSSIMKKPSGSFNKPSKKEIQRWEETFNKTFYFSGRETMWTKPKVFIGIVKEYIEKDGSYLRKGKSIFFKKEKGDKWIVFDENVHTFLSTSEMERYIAPVTNQKENGKKVFHWNVAFATRAEALYKRIMREVHAKENKERDRQVSPEEEDISQANEKR